jgi:hypothetical protein
MPLTTAQAFSQFLEDITATDSQKTTFIPNRKKTVEENLSTAFPATSDMPFWNGVLIGSACKNTVIRPLDDIDVLAVFSNGNKAWNKYWNDSKSFISRVRNAYDGLVFQQVGTRGQAVRVFFKTGGHVDVAPVFFKGDGVYHLPDGTGGWILTAPSVANDWFATRNKELNYNLAPLVRLIKSWNRAHSKRMRSFHLETVTGTLFSSLGSNYRNGLQSFFEWAPNWLNVNDPGGQSGSLSSYLTSSGRQDLLTALSTAADRAKRANEAEASGDHAEAKRLWKIILGDDFPTS